MRITILGSGSSSGVPMVGCECAVCTSENPKNVRTRVSIVIEHEGRHILVDTSPDLHQQSIRHNLRTIDAVLYTHAHADHTHGIDDLRSFNYHLDDVLPAYSDAKTLQTLTNTFAYVFQPRPQPVWFRPALEAHPIEVAPPKAFDAAGLAVIPFWQHHGSTKSLGFRMGNTVYSTDANGFPKESEPMLEGLELWIVDCLRYTDSWTHAKLEMTLEWIEKFKPKRAVLTHMSHHFEYDTLKAALPNNVEPGYDGMVLDNLHI